MRASQNLSVVNPALEVLMFSIYYAAVTSLQSLECQMELKEARQVLLQRYGEIFSTWSLRRICGLMLPWPFAVQEVTCYDCHSRKH